MDTFQLVFNYLQMFDFSHTIVHVLINALSKQQFQQMEINKPDRGVFKGIGQLETETHINKKYFPKVRNIHQFQYTHHHRNDYLTSFQRFFSAAKTHNHSIPEKVKQNTNNSTLQFGQDTNNYYNSLSRTDYKHFEKVIPPKPIRQKQEGVVLGDDNDIKAQYLTTAIEKFGSREYKEKAKVTFRDRGLQRFNPITGQTRTLGFGFEDFAMGRKNNYVANNVSRIPQTGQHFDIISGRKLTYK